MDDIKFSRSTKGTSEADFELPRRENCFRTVQYNPEHPLQEKGQSGWNECSQGRPFPSTKTDRFPGLRILPGHGSHWFCRELCRPISSCSSKWWFSGIRFSKWDEILLSMTQNLRMRNWSRKWKFWSKRRGQKSWGTTAWTKKSGRLLAMESWRAVFKRRQLQFRTQYEEACRKSTQPNPSPNSFMQQDEKKASKTRSPRGRSPMWKNVSTAVLGSPQRKLQHSNLWEVASSGVLVLQG